METISRYKDDLQVAPTRLKENFLPIGEDEHGNVLAATDKFFDAILDVIKCSFAPIYGNGLGALNALQA